jgi:hypothetical protein
MGFMSKATSYTGHLSRKNATVGSDGCISSQLMSMARKHTSEIIYTIMCLENKIDELIKYLIFFDDYHDRKRFSSVKHEVMSKSGVGLSAKIHQLLTCLSDFGFLNSMKKKLLQDSLMHFTRLYNAFIYGVLIYRDDVGVCLSYYEGQKYLKCLDDKFWLTCNRQLITLSSILDEAIEKSKVPLLETAS